jgi:hypothetical protein
MPSNISKQNPQPTSPLDILRHETLQDRRSLFLHRHHRPLAFTARLLLGNDPDDLAFVLSITQSSPTNRGRSSISRSTLPVFLPFPSDRFSGC